MTRRILQIVLALAILIPYTSLHSQSEKAAQGKEAFNGFDLVDKAGNIRKPTDVSGYLPVSRNLHSHGFQR